MNRRPSWLRNSALACLLSLPMLALRPSAASHDRLSPFHNLPRHTLWAWERREDLTSIDPRTTAVASLEQTILIANSTASAVPHVLSQPRRQPLTLPTNARRIAVVRIEVQPGTPLPATIDAEVLDLLLATARQPNIAALQIDFDATHSQRPFYRRILEQLRPRLPSQLPLSITALASWCSYDDWIAHLPVDEAVPMLFRMEPDRRRSRSPDLDIREPLCLQSTGISTREAWPADLAGRRVYIFPDRGWQQDLPLLSHLPIPHQRTLP